MLRLPKHHLIAAGAAALAVSAASLAQGQGTLSERLDAAETKLQADAQACKPINLGEYTAVLAEAAKNVKRAAKATKAGAPVNAMQVDADFAKASKLFNTALAALVQQCMRSARQQAQPPSTSLKPPLKMGAGVQQYLDARKRCDLEGMTAAVSGPGGIGINEWSQKYLTEAKLLNFPEDVKRCADPGAGGTTPLPIYDPKYVSQPDLAPGPRQQQAQSIDPDKATIPLADPASVGGALSPFARDFLAVHNATRAQFGAPPLKWDAEMAGRAGDWAGELARIGRLEHAPRENRGTERENLAQAPLNYSDVQIVGRWAGEKNDFVPGVFPNICRSGAVCEGVLHISQMIWPTTVAIGCGKAVGQGSQWVVCRYNPGGNKDGKMVGIPQTQVLADLDTKVEQPKLGEVFNANTVKPASLIDGRPGIGDGTSREQLGMANDMLKRSVEEMIERESSVPLVPDVISSNDSIILNHDYGYDRGLFVGYDLGGFGIESEVAYKKAEQAASGHAGNAPLFDLGHYLGGAWTPDYGDSSSGMANSPTLSFATDMLHEFLEKEMAGGDGPGGAEDVGTNVEQPELPKGEVFKPDPPATLEDPL